MRAGRAVFHAALAMIGAVCWTQAADEPAFTDLFDGKTLKGWSNQHTNRFFVKDGVIVNDGGTGWLRSDKVYRDFEFRAEYRIIRPGSDSGIFFRASAESADKPPNWPARCYQLQVIDGDGTGMLFGHGLAPPRFERKTDTVRKARKDAKQWQKIRLKVQGTRAEVVLNDVVITTTEAIQAPEGHIGLQGENGHIEWRASGSARSRRSRPHDDFVEDDGSGLIRWHTVTPPQTLRRLPFWQVASFARFCASTPRVPGAIGRGNSTMNPPILTLNHPGTMAWIIPYAAKSETSSNVWNLSVISVFSCSAWIVERPSRVSWMAA